MSRQPTRSSLSAVSSKSQMVEFKVCVNYIHVYLVFNFKSGKDRIKLLDGKEAEIVGFSQEYGFKKNVFRDVLFENVHIITK